MNALVRGWIGTVLVLLLAGTAMADEIEDGRRIYQEGILPSGRPLTGTRFGNVTVSGRDAACISCHRRSGMGSVEGDLQVPPVTGRFLFAAPGDLALASMDRRSGRSMNQRHTPYTDETLAVALRRGVDSEGRPMGVAMPRFLLSEAEAHAVTTYLRQLSSGWSPGVTGRTIRFATVIAPGVDPARREALLATLRAAVAQKNGSTVVSRAGGRRHMVTPAEMVLGTERSWQLDVWELQGDPSTWSAQLEEYYIRAPVFALLSGISDGEWQPVDDFCDAHALPCWFPSVPAAPATPRGYGLYFSRGTTLEAAVLAQWLRDHRPNRLLQIRRDDTASREAAAALAVQIQGKTSQQVLGNGSTALADALAHARAGDLVMLWLDAADLHPLASLRPAPGVTYCFSGRLAGTHTGIIPAEWRKSAHVIWPWALPSRQQANLEYFRAWVAIRQLPVVDEALQSEAWFAVDYLSSTLAGMLDNLQRDYLLERAEEMLGRSEAGRAEDEMRVALPGGPTTNRPREGSTVYARLNLGPGEHFASRGAWMLRFDANGRPVAESEWIVPAEE